MTFVSYAQNFEDVMLWRALKHVENGFYIDVGANDPTLYSVTRAFYDHGWHGINLEPVSQFFKRLEQERPRDINLQLGAGERDGSFPFFDVPETGLATSDQEVAEMHRQQGWDVREIAIQILPLTTICNRHVSGDIHFLKIDVEGAEESVLRGIDLTRWRPWIMVVEATRPMSPETVHENWEPLIVNAGYDYVYFDGLNRYYVAHEHAELKAAFALPPNVFDNFILNTNQESQLRVAESEARAQVSRQHAQEAERQRIDAEQRRAEAEQRRAEAEQRRMEAERRQAEADAAARAAADHALAVETHLQEVIARLTRAEALLSEVFSTKSWRITAPLRWVNSNSGHLRNAAHQAVTSPRSFAVRVARFGVRKSLPIIKSSPLLMRGARQIQTAFPDAASRLVYSMKAAPPGSDSHTLLATPVLQQDMPAWGGTVTAAEQFKHELSRELQQRTNKQR